MFIECPIQYCSGHLKWGEQKLSISATSIFNLIIQKLHQMNKYVYTNLKIFNLAQNSAVCRESFQTMGLQSRDFLLSAPHCITSRKHILIYCFQNSKMTTGLVEQTHVTNWSISFLGIAGLHKCHLWHSLLTVGSLSYQEEEELEIFSWQFFLAVQVTGH